jgi:kinesin family protein 2/24
LLAPFESGIQLLRLPAPEFDSRCLKSEGVTPEYARAFRSKLEQKHVDSQRPARDTKKAVSFLDRTDLLSSKDPDPKSASLPFTERIRPGMAVQWYPPQSFSPVLPKVKNLAVVLCPVSGLKEIPSSAQHRPEAVQSSTERQFLCAVVLPGGIPNSHTVSLWRQVVVDVEWMTAEVMLEYDAATRYYHLAV